VEPLLRTAAEQGWSDAMVELACWLKEHGADEALVWLRKASELNHSHAQYLLACHLLEVPPDWVTQLVITNPLSGPPDDAAWPHPQALALLRHASLAGHAAAQLRLAMALAAQGEWHDRAVMLSRCAAAHAGSIHRAVACLLLGRAYLRGSGVATSMTRAATWLTRALADSTTAAAAEEELRGSVRCVTCGVQVRVPGDSGDVDASAAPVTGHACKFCDAVALCGRLDCVDSHEDVAHAPLPYHGSSDFDSPSSGGGSSPRSVSSNGDGGSDT
jgi:hypothetical protein